jgi:hypothetical protein
MRGQRRENVRTQQGAGALPNVLPFDRAAEEFRDMTGRKVKVQETDRQCGEWPQDEAWQRELHAMRHAILSRVHRNSSTVAKGSEDHGLKRWIVSLVGFPGATSTWR